MTGKCTISGINVVVGDEAVVTAMGGGVVVVVEVVVEVEVVVFRVVGNFFGASIRFTSTGAGRLFIARTVVGIGVVVVVVVEEVIELVTGGTVGEEIDEMIDKGTDERISGGTAVDVETSGSAVTPYTGVVIDSIGSAKGVWRSALREVCSRSHSRSFPSSLGKEAFVAELMTIHFDNRFTR